MKKRKLFTIGMILFLTITPFFLLGCANQPTAFCPEIKVTFCPVK